MKRIGLIITALLASLFLPSCLTIEESYEFKRNGSGMMEYRIEVSDMADFLESLNTDESKLPTDKLSMADMAPQLSEIEGVSHVEVLDNTAEKIYGLRFRFKSLEVLNDALNLLLKKDASASPHLFFTKEENVITRNHLNTRQSIASEFLDDSDEEGKTLAILQSMNYKINMKFARPVKVVYAMAETSIIGKKSKEVKLETSMRDLIEESEMLNTSIVLK